MFGGIVFYGHAHFYLESSFLSHYRFSRFKVQFKTKGVGFWFLIFLYQSELKK